MGAFRDLMEYVFLAPTAKEEGDLRSYLKRIQSNSFEDRVVYGISDDKRGFLSLDPVKQPGALYCGGMGSGKSVAMRFTVATHMANNSKNTFYILVDPLKGMTDYAMLFKDEVDSNGKKIADNPYKSNVVAAIDDVAKFIPVIEMVHKEAMARKEKFSEIGAPNIYDYEKKTGEKIARIMVCIEEFHAIPNANEVKFTMKQDQPGTVANKLKELMRIGRSYGIFFMLATQRATSEDVPSQIKPGLSMLMCFKMNQPGEASALNLAHAIDIGVEQRGRCAYEDGFIQYPYLSDDAMQQVLDQYYKPLEAKMFSYCAEDFHKALGGEGSEGMVQVKDLREIVEQAAQYKFQDIVERFLKEFKFEFEDQKNDAFKAELVATKEGVRYAVKLIKDRNDGSDKEIKALGKGASSLNCSKIIIMGLEGNMSTISRAAKDITQGREDIEEVILIDKEDFRQMAAVLENKAELEQKGQYRDMYLELELASEGDLPQMPAKPLKTEEIKKADSFTPEAKALSVEEEKIIPQVVERKIEPIKKAKELKPLEVIEKSSSIEKVKKIVENKESIVNDPKTLIKSSESAELDAEQVEIVKRLGAKLFENPSAKEDAVKGIKGPQKEVKPKPKESQTQKLTQESLLAIRERLRKDILES